MMLGKLYWKVKVLADGINSECDFYLGLLFDII